MRIRTMFRANDGAKCHVDKFGKDIMLFFPDIFGGQRFDNYDSAVQYAEHRGYRFQ